ncbi:MAG: hypothetical protein IT457_01375 [Planctomycetes bacterium]|nr:hypothetical protein [Planctomycetota bacterium]
MAAKNKSESFDFVVSLLEKNPTISYADVAAAAQKKGFKIYPIVYGRAKAKLGLVPTAPRGTGPTARAAKKQKAAAAAAASPAPAAAPAARAAVRKAPAPSSSSSVGTDLEGIIAHVKASETARARYRAALERIRDILEDVIN